MNTEQLFIEPARLICFGTLAVGIAVELYRPKGFGGLDLIIFRAFVALILLTKFQDAFKWIGQMGSFMAQELSEKLGDRSLKVVIFDALEQSKSNRGGAGPSVVGAIEQSLRVGVWGVLSAVVQYVYMVLNFLMEVTQRTLFHLNLVLFPLALGFYPLFSAIATQMFLYAIELSLWLPMLVLVERASARVAETYLSQEGSVGIPIVATELLGILLMAGIPVLAHKFVTGSFNGLSQSTGGSHVGKTISLTSSTASKVSSYGMKGLLP